MIAGLMPYNFLCVHSGAMLSEVTELSDIFNFYTTLKLLGFALVALLPASFVKYYQNEINQMRKEKA